MAAGASIAALLAAARGRLGAAGAATPALDARVLLCAAAGLSHEDVLRTPDAVLGPEPAALFETFVERRLAGEPVARIAGVKEFWGLEFELDAATLVPRPDSETLVGALCRLLAGRRHEALRIADLGTGSGCLMVAILSEFPHALGIACDIAPHAARLARVNARRHGVMTRMLACCADWADALAGGVDAIVANPPYICSSDLASLAREVRAFDPPRALDGGEDGLSAYRALMPSAHAALKPGGHLLLEVGAGQAGDVQAICAAAGFALVADADSFDLAGVERVVVAAKPRKPV